MKWFLISEETIKLIRDALSAPTHAENDYNCPDAWDSCRGCNGDEKREAAIYELDTSLHTTDAVPSDLETTIA